MSEKKIQVIKSLTSVVKANSDLDPKAFFSLLSSNYDVLATGDVFDGQRLYEAMSGTTDGVVLDKLFTGFEVKLRETELGLSLPPHLEAMPPERRQQIW